MLDLWRLPSDAPIVHLAVHPSAWASNPPSVATTVNPISIPTAAAFVPAVPPPAPTSHGAGGHNSAHPPPVVYAGLPPRPTQPSTGLPLQAALPTPTSIPGLAPISVGYINFVAFQHLRAAMVLRRGHGNEDPLPTGLAESRNLAVQLMTIWGYAWPTILDDTYPPPQDESAGIKYEPVTIDGQEYLKLVDPSKMPTPLQAHALPPHGHSHLPVHVNAHLQQIGLAPLRVRQENAMIAELRAVPMRALAAPLFMLTLRTLFLLYFFSPFQKPVFGLVVTAWLLYETWNTIRNAMPRRHDARILGNARVRPAAEAVHPLVPDAPLRAPAPLPARAPAIAAPTIGHRIKTFVELLVLTAHPPCDGDIQADEARARAAQARADLNAIHSRRPAWVIKYMERVRGGDWVDDQ
ncbi:hypothetical protein EI94DRAFT_1737243 [Lactarius quietus]|nr:hypothetical protein EI94DRAFT_1737243 [Lactarius quietus]